MCLFLFKTDLIEHNSTSDILHELDSCHYQKSSLILEKTICRFLDSADTQNPNLKYQAGTKAAEQS